MNGSERLFVSGNSWFSVKTIQVVYLKFKIIGKALINLGDYLIRIFEVSETINNNFFFFKKTDLEREGSKSKGKQP